MKISTRQARPIVEKTFPEYTGRKFSIEFVTQIHFYDTNWSGGTRNEYMFVRADGNVADLPVCAPWMNPVEGKIVEIPADILVVVHSHFCGHDMGIRIYANPVHTPKWLS